MTDEHNSDDWDTEVDLTLVKRNYADADLDADADSDKNEQVDVHPTAVEKKQQVNIELKKAKPIQTIITFIFVFAVVLAIQYLIKEKKITGDYKQYYIWARNAIAGMCWIGVIIQAASITYTQSVLCFAIFPYWIIYAIGNNIGGASKGLVLGIMAFLATDYFLLGDQSFGLLMQGHFEAFLKMGNKVTHVNTSPVK